MEKELPFRLRQETVIEKWRADTFWTKEPETIAWINTFRPGESFLDIGANIGIYSLYAATRGVRVVSVEPHPGNFQALALNHRQLNRHLSMRPIFAGVGDRDELRDFWFDTVEAGSTGGSHSAKKKQRQHVRVYKTDSIVQAYGPFIHIKIDVDGEEKQIIRGMHSSLRFQQFDSCLIEIDLKMREEIIEQFETHGYTRDNIFNIMTPHSRERRAQEGIHVENIVFTRTGRYP